MPTNHPLILRSTHLACVLGLLLSASAGCGDAVSGGTEGAGGVGLGGAAGGGSGGDRGSVGAGGSMGLSCSGSVTDPDGPGGEAGDGGQYGSSIECLDSICTEDVEEFVLERSNGELHPHGAGVVIAVIGPDGDFIEMSYGMANIELGIPLGPDTPFNLASVTKQFTATAVMMLYEEGKLDPQDLVADYFPEVPQAWIDDGLTIHHLLTHQSGIPDFINDLRPARNWTNEEVLAWAVSAAPEFSPGERYEYSNTGYALLATLIERVSGESYPDFVRQQIFEPLGMTSSFVPEDWPSNVPNEAQSYLRTSQPGVFFPLEYARTASGEGTNHSTLRDLQRWEQHLRSPTLICPETAELMVTPYARGYGYGWAIDSPPDEPTNVNHAGSTSGYRTMITRAPEEGITVIMLSNGSFNWAFSTAQDLWRLVLGLEIEFD